MSEGSVYGPGTFKQDCGLKRELHVIFVRYCSVAISAQCADGFHAQKQITTATQTNSIQTQALIHLFIEYLRIGFYYQRRASALYSYRNSLHDTRCHIRAANRQTNGIFGCETPWSGSEPYMFSILPWEHAFPFVFYISHLAHLSYVYYIVYTSIHKY